MNIRPYFTYCLVAHAVIVGALLPGISIAFASDDERLVFVSASNSAITPKNVPVNSAPLHMTQRSNLLPVDSQQTTATPRTGHNAGSASTSFFQQDKPTKAAASSAGITRTPAKIEAQLSRTVSSSEPAQIKRVISDTQRRYDTQMREQNATFTIHKETPYQATYSNNKSVNSQVSVPSEGEIKALFYRAALLAIRISPKIGSSRALSEAALQSVEEAKGQRWPQIDVSSNSKSLYFGGGEETGSHDAISFGVSAATTIYDFGQLNNTIKSREDQAKATHKGIAVESENTAWEVSNALIELHKQRLIIQFSEDFVARMQQLTSMLSGIVNTDPGRRSELTQARGKLYQAQSSLDAAKARARDSEIVLHRLLGKSNIVLPPGMVWNLSTANIDAQLMKLEQHPIIAKAKAETAAALSEAAAVKSSGLPTLNWVVSKNTAKDGLGRTQAFQTGINVNWGLFRGGSTVASERAALLRAEANRYLVDEQRHDLQQRIRAADQDARSSLQRADLYENLTQESDRIRLDFFDQWYHLGKRTLLDVLGAESDYYNNRVAIVSSRFDGYSAIFRGYASTGELLNWLGQKTR